MGIPKHFPCPECGNDGSDVDELEWQVKELGEQLAKANERVKQLESAVATAVHTFEKYEMDVDTYPTIEHVKIKGGLLSHLNKFAIENQIKALEFILKRVESVTLSHAVKDHIVHRIKQLRKGNSDA